MGRYPFTIQDDLIECLSLAHRPTRRLAIARGTPLWPSVISGPTTIPEFLSRTGFRSFARPSPRWGNWRWTGSVVIKDGMVLPGNSENGKLARFRRAGSDVTERRMTGPHQGESQAGAWVATRPSLPDFTPRIGMVVSKSVSLTFVTTPQRWTHAS